MYTDQVPKNDLSRGLAARHDFKIASSGKSVGDGEHQLAGSFGATSML
jgi:hypothetical protein